MKNSYPGRMASARPGERAAMMLERIAAGTRGGSAGYLIFEHEGALYRAQPHPATGSRMWSRWPSGEPCPCPFTGAANEEGD